MRTNGHRESAAPIDLPPDTDDLELACDASHGHCDPTRHLESEMPFRTGMFTVRDREILSSVEPIVDAVASLFGDACEVVLHSLEDMEHSVVKIANGHVTGRTVGSPVTDLAIRMLGKARESETDVLPPYYSKTKDGKTLRSVTSLIRNEEGRPIGFMCINFNLDAPILSILRGLSSCGEDDENESPEHFVESTEELVHRAFHDAVRETAGAAPVSGLQRNRLIVRNLLQRGIFDIRGAVDIIAKQLGVSRYTIYNYIREARS